MNQKNGIGCFGLLTIVILISLVVQYWYVVVAAIVLGGATWHYYHQKRVAIAQAQAEEEYQQAAEGSKIDQIRRFKELLDEGAITQEEFDQQKQRILDDHDDDKLEF